MLADLATATDMDLMEPCDPERNLSFLCKQLYFQSRSSAPPRPSQGWVMIGKNAQLQKKVCRDAPYCPTP